MTRTPSRLDGDRHVEHAPTLFGIVVREHRGEHVAGRNLTGEHLAPADPVSAIDGHRGAPWCRVVGAAGRHQHDRLIGHTAQRRLGSRQPAAVAPRGEQHDVVVHRRSQCRRGAVAGELTLRHRHLGDGGAVATQLGGNGEGEVAARAQQAGSSRPRTGPPRRAGERAPRSPPPATWPTPRTAPARGRVIQLEDVFSHHAMTVRTESPDVIGRIPGLDPRSSAVRPGSMRPRAVAPVLLAGGGLPTLAARRLVLGGRATPDGCCPLAGVRGLAAVLRGFGEFGDLRLRPLLGHALVLERPRTASCS